MFRSAFNCLTIIRKINLLGQRQIYTSQQCFRSDLTIVDVNDKTGVATLTMNRPPINALNFELLSAMMTDLQDAKKNNSRGLILTSSLRSVFSGGLDLTELYKPDKERLTAICTGIHDVALSLNTQPAPVVALINGHAPAGGCVLAMSCEYRIMLPNYTIGLNEPVLGLVVTEWIMKVFLDILPKRVAELALTQGKLFLTDEAYKVGLVDEIVNDKEEGLERCKHFVDRFKTVNATARVQTKNNFQFNDLFVDKLQMDRFVEFIMQPKVQEIVGVYLMALKNKSKK